MLSLASTAALNNACLFVTMKKKVPPNSGEVRCVYSVFSFLPAPDGPALINVNIYLRTISRIDDVKMVR